MTTVSNFRDFPLTNAKIWNKAETKNKKASWKRKWHGKSSKCG
jgi:hypothetical protein